MGFLQAIFETKAAAKNAIPRATGASPALNQIGLGAVGPWDTENAIKAGYERVIWIFRCVDVISQNQASLKINLVKGLDRGLQKQEIIESPRLNKVLNFRANTYESSWQFRYRLSSQLLLSRRGAFIEIIKGRDGLPSELHLLPPQATEPIPDAKKFVSGYKVKRSDYDYDELKPEQVIWVKLKPHPTDPYQQMTPLVAAGIEADTDFLARLFNRNFLANDGRPGMLITIDPGATPLDPVDAETIKARFSGGPSHAGQTTVIEAAGINAEDLSASPRDIQWDTLLSSSKERLLMAFGVPESVMGNASGRCVDDQTEALTQRGWVNGRDLTTDDTILSVDPADGRLKWGPVREVYRNENYSGLMYRLQNIGAVVSPGHKWVIEPRTQWQKDLAGDDLFTRIPVEDLSTHDRIVTMGEAESGVEESEYTDAFVELVGWAVTEGHYWPNEWSRKNKPNKVAPYIKIRQSIGPNLDRIERCAKEAGAQYIVRDDGTKAMVSIRGEIAAAVTQVSPEKVMTKDFILSLTQRQRELLLQTMIDADGCRQKKTASLTFAQTNKAATEAFIFLATLCGYTTSMRYREYNYTHKGVTSRKGDWIAVVRSRKMSSIQHGARTTEQYTGLIWCPRTDYGTFIARRDGKVFATSNTFDNADAERENFWLDTMFTHCNGIASALDPLSGDSTDEQVFAFNYEEVEVLQRMAARKREEWRAEVAAGVRTIDSYFEATGDMPWDVLETRILMKPNGVFIGSTPADIEAAKKIVPISATPAQPPMDGGGGAFGAPPMQNGGFMPVQSQQRFDNAANELSVAARALAISQRKSGKRRPETKGHRALRVVGSPPAAEDDPEAVPDVDVLLFEAELAGVLTAWDQQQEKVIPARLDHAKVRKGTRHWEGFEGETKALSTAYIVEVEQWIMQVRDAMQELVKKHIEREARKALAKLRRTGILDTMLALDKASGVGVGAEAAFPDPFSHAAAMNLVYMNSMEIVDNAVRRQSQRVARKITEMDNSGKPLTDIKAEVRRMLGARAQWRRSLATNVATSVTEGTKEAVYSRSEGLMTKTWRTHADERVRTAHRLLEGQQPAADGLWHTAIGNLRFPGDPLAPPALTVNCFPATTKVRGQINGAYRSEYEGDLVTITTGHGVELTGTPNHPILTGRGWVPLKDIQKGDHVVRHVGEGQAVVGHHVDAVPLMIGKVFDALSQSFPLVRHTGSRVDFHGDIPTGKVDVVLADGQLRNDWYTPADHFIRQFLFPSTDSYAGLSMAGRTLLQRGKRVLLPPASTVGSLSVGSTLVGRQSLHPKDIGFRDTASVNVVAGQVTAERIATDTGFLSQGILGLPGKVALDEVRSVDVQRFSGHVYNLSTMTGAYTSNSIIAHNCRCWVEHIPNFDALVAAYA